MLLLNVCRLCFVSIVRARIYFLDFLSRFAGGVAFSKLMLLARCIRCERKYLRISQISLKQKSFQVSCLHCVFLFCLFAYFSFLCVFLLLFHHYHSLTGDINVYHTSLYLKLRLNLRRSPSLIALIDFCLSVLISLPSLSTSLLLFFTLRFCFILYPLTYVADWFPL